MAARANGFIQKSAMLIHLGGTNNLVKNSKDIEKRNNIKIFTY
ncbi:hypothetical protein [Mucilaginibacter flavidus]|nr:hypothetical protein [Mucilaginibacter flavidus]